MARISVVGTGYVGLTTGACFAEMGHMVSCIDVDEAKISRLNVGDMPIFEPGLNEIVGANREAGRLTFTTDYAKGLNLAEFVFIAVGTPPVTNGNAAEMKFVFEATTQIGRTLQQPAIIVNKSTSPIGTAGKLSRLLQEGNPDLGPWFVVSNPEFLREGSAVEDCLQPTRVVLGSDSPDSASSVAALYGDLACPIIVTDLNTAEMIKYASNAFLATRISFINEVARICDALNADVMTVAEGMGLDPRIGREFLRAGLGYGGSCFPKDVAALKHMASEAGLHPQLLNAVTEINEDQRRWVLERLDSCMNGTSGKIVALWGVAFKPNTDDLRQAPALDVASRLLQRGAAVRIFDPVVGSVPIDATVCESLEESVQFCDAVLIGTEWDEFLGVDWHRIASLMRGDVVFDARNCLDPRLVEAGGLRYAGIGRGYRTVVTEAIAL